MKSKIIVISIIIVICVGLFIGVNKVYSRYNNLPIKKMTMEEIQTQYKQNRYALLKENENNNIELECEIYVIYENGSILIDNQNDNVIYDDGIKLDIITNDNTCYKNKFFDNDKVKEKIVGLKHGDKVKIVGHLLEYSFLVNNYLKVYLVDIEKVGEKDN